MSQDDAILKLREAIEAFSAQRAPELVAEAQAEAVAKARTMLAEAMAQSLLDHAGANLAPTGRTSGPRPSSERSRGRKRQRPAKAASTAPSPAKEAGEEQGYYVYGVMPADEARVPDELAGVDPTHPAMLIEHGGLAAIASRVSLSEFGEEQLHENLNDVRWLEDKARAHEDVLDAALQLATVVPMRLCTIYSSEEQVREMLGQERGLLLDALQRLAGKAEWGVKMIAEPHALERAAAQRAGSGAEDETATRGTAYMNRKRREASARDEEDQVAEEWAHAVHERLAQAASEALLNPLQRPEVGGYEGDMLLNGVYLVDDDAVEELRTLVDRLAEEHHGLGVTVELTGPWPPYNFVKSSIEAAR